MSGVRPGPAVRYARELEQWEPNEWWRVEARALQSVPDVRFALAFFSPTAAWKGLSKGVPQLLGCLMLPLNIGSFTMPVIAAVAMLGWLVKTSADDPLRPGAPLLTVGVMTAISAVVEGIGTIRNSRQWNKADDSTGRMLGLLHLIPSAVSLLIGLVAVAQQALETPWDALGFIGIVLDVAAGVASLFVYRGRPATNELRWQVNFTRLEMARDAVPAADQAAMLADIRAAVDVLVGKGFVSDEDGIRALDVKFGLLGIVMAPRPDLTTPDGLPGAEAWFDKH